MANPRRSGAQQWLLGMVGPLAATALVVLLRSSVAWNREVTWFLAVVLTSLGWFATWRPRTPIRRASTGLGEFLATTFYATAWAGAAWLPPANDRVSTLVVTVFLVAIGAGALLAHGGRRSLVWCSETVLALGALLCASRLSGTEGWTLAATVVAVFGLLIILGRRLDLLSQRLLAAERSVDDVRANAECAQRALLEANADLVYRATHDPLTGLANRATLSETLHRQIRAIRGPRAGLAVLYLDLDHFKDVNDRFGHDTGDRLLGLLAKRLSAGVRPGDLVARLGGDEMACVLAGVTEEESETLAQRLLARSTMAVNLDHVTLQIGMSIGLAWTNCSTTEPDELLRRADQALYDAKRTGRNRISIAAPVLTD